MRALGMVEESKRRKARGASARSQTARRVRQPVVLTGVRFHSRMTVEPSMFHRLDVDRRYQRDRVSSEVGDLVRAIQSGGLVPDPVTLATRDYAEGGERSGKLWIIDGQQRTWAFLHADRAFQADVYEVDSLEAERAFFIVMNSKKRVNAGRLVDSWPGLSAALLRQVEADASRPLSGRITFEGGVQRGQILATVLLRGMYSAMTGTMKAGSVELLLQSADDAMARRDGSQSLASRFLDLVPMVFTGGSPAEVWVLGLGLVAHERWTSGKQDSLPPASIIKKLARLKWEGMTPTLSRKYLPMVVARVLRCWP